MKTSSRSAGDPRRTANRRAHPLLPTGVHARRRRSWLRVVAALAALTLGACAADPEGSSHQDPFAPPVAYPDYCGAYAELGCSAAARCDCLGQVSLETCETYLRAECQDDVEAPVDAGRMAYHEDEAGRCLAAIEAIVADCSLDGDDYPESCDDMLTGLIEAGGDCDGDEECRPGLECVSATCAELPREGEPCYGDGYCAEGYSCADDGLCHAYGGFGSSCGGGVYCDDDLYCNEQNETCEPYLSLGDDCSFASWACDDDLYCSPSSDRCTGYPAVGTSCVDSGGICVDDAYCAVDGSCQAQLPAGSECTLAEQCLSYECDNGACLGGAEDGCPFL